MRNLSKHYRRYARPVDMLRELIFKRTYHETSVALDNVSFDVQKGQVVGIIGRNGAGKSTLLKILAGTLDKSMGEIEVNGRISAILELGSGFNPLYTGRENIFMGGTVLGMSSAEIAGRTEWIIDFSELREVIDRPFHTYSSGMQARLTFAVAVSVNPDIFMVDEALAAGDAYFVSKSLGRIKEICNSGSTVLFVSHSSGLILQLCDLALWLENGHVRGFGDPLSVVREYDYEVHLDLARGKGEVLALVEPEPLNMHASPRLLGDKPDHKKIFRVGPVNIESVQFLDPEGIHAFVHSRWEKMTVAVQYRCQGPIPEETLGLAVAINRVGDFLPICQVSTLNVQADQEYKDYHQAEFRKPAGQVGTIAAVFDPLQLAEGQYYISVGLLPNISGSVEFYEYHHYGYKISVLRNGFPLAGLVYYPMVQWHHQDGVTTTNDNPKMANR